MPKQKNCLKTSVNLPVGLTFAYGGKGKEMKRAVLAIRPADLKDAALRNLLKKYGIKVQKGETNLWKDQSYFEELFTLLFPNPSDRKNLSNVKLHLTREEHLCICKLSCEAKFTTAFRIFLLLHYAMHQQNNMAQIKQNARDYYNHEVLRLPVISSHTNACQHMPTSPKQKNTSHTGLKVHGNKHWFLNDFNEILQAVPDEIDTFVEPCMGSGIITLEAYKQNRFKRIITNDIYWHKANYLQAFFLKSDALKAACLSLTPDLKTYNNAKNIIKKYENSSTDKILPDVAANYLFINYCHTSRGGLNKNNLIEYNADASEEHINYLDCLWNSYRSTKKVIIHNEDALDTIKRHNRKKHLLFVDPPYPKTKGYEVDFSVKDFENIAKATINFNGKFIFCCRITNKKSTIHTHKDAYGLDDLHIKHIIDNLFFGHKLYYRDYLYNKGGVAIERVITNFPFKGCYHYDTGELWQEKE